MTDLMFLGALVLALACVGCVSGFLAGLLGVGGGIVIVPVLFYVFDFLDIPSDVRAHLAVGTSLATIVPTSIISLRGHHRRGAVDADLLRRWAGWIAAGVLLGVLVAGVLDGSVLTAVFGVVALAVSLHMAISREGLSLMKTLPPYPAQGLIATFIGGFSTLMGIGGGTLTVPILSLFNYPVKRAVGTASAIGLVIAIPGTIGFVLQGWDAPGLPPLSLGYVSLPGLLAIVPTSIVFAPLGVRAAHAIKALLLRRAFAVFLGVTAFRMLRAALT